MKSYEEMTKEELLKEKEGLEAEYKKFQQRGLKLDMSRGKPSQEQLDLSMGMMDVLSSSDDLTCEDGTDCRNYGGLTGIKEAIAAAYPQTEYQRCIVHQVRNTLKYVSDKDRKAFANDLKTIYLATFEATKKWTMPIRNWGRVYGELAIMYDGRLPD